MAITNGKKNECCTNSKNLPEEMEAAIRHQGGMERIKDLIPSKESFTVISNVLNATSNPIRLQIMHSLKMVDLCPCLLKDITELSNSKLNYHLNILEEAGIITSSPRKRWRIYMLTDLGKSLIKIERTIWPDAATPIH